jgi:chaperonin cofactor prefoldin
VNGPNQWRFPAQPTGDPAAELDEELAQLDFLVARLMDQGLAIQERLDRIRARLRQ